MFISVVIASKGRPQILEETLDSVANQIRAPDEVIVVVTAQQDLSLSTRARGDLRVFFSAPGGAVQRNLALDHLSERSDVVVFLDDDIELARDYLVHVENFLICRPEVVGLSGLPLRDRAENGLLPRDQARALLRAASEQPPAPSLPRRGLYGCNMVARSRAARAVRFDPNLVLYSFLEDRDFGGRLAAWGQTVDYGGSRVIHLSTPSGRGSELRLGFTQVMNPTYLYFSKRSLSLPEFLRIVVLAVGTNLLSLVGADRLVHATHTSADRPKRLRGNLLAFRALMRGKIDPKQVAAIPAE